MARHVCTHRVATVSVLGPSIPFSDKFFLINLFIFIQLQFSAFSPLPSTPSQPVPPPSPTSTLPLDFVLVSFIVAPIDPSPHYPLPTPLWVHLHNGILRSREKEGAYTLCNGMDGTGEHYAK